MRHFEVLGIAPTRDEAVIREAIMRETLDWSERVLRAQSPSERRAAESHLRAVDDARRALLAPAGQRPHVGTPAPHLAPGRPDAPPPVARVRFYRDEEEAYAQQFQPGYEAAPAATRYDDDFDDSEVFEPGPPPRSEGVNSTTKWVAGLAGLGLFMAGMLWAGGVFDSPVKVPPPLPTAVDPQVVQGGAGEPEPAGEVLIPPPALPETDLPDAQSRVGDTTSEGAVAPAEPVARPPAPVVKAPTPERPQARATLAPRPPAVTRPAAAPAGPRQVEAPGAAPRPAGTERWVSQSGAFALEYPADRLKPVGAVPAGGGQRFVSEDGQVVMDVVARYNGDSLNVKRALALASAPVTGRRVTYQANGASWYVQSGYEGGKLFYEKTWLRNRQIKSLRIVMPSGHRDRYYDTIEAISHSFKSLD